MDPNRIVAGGRDRAPAEPPRNLIESGSTPPDTQTLAAFGLVGEESVALPYGEERSYKVGHAVLKHLRGGSAEVVGWAADLHASIREDGFRVARPLPVEGGGWVTEDGWSASVFLEGHHDYRQHVEACISAITRYHAALEMQPRPAFFDTLDGPFRRADRYAFGERPSWVHPELEEQVDALYALRKPLVGLQDQLIHGDLNPSNLLVADGQPPGIIDIAPYWRPASFALAVFAYWIGPWRGRPDLLAQFAHVEQFDQLLIRASIRMLLFMSEFGRLTDMDWYTRATKLIGARSRRSRPTRGSPA
jgi:uncharacterized protein (TIGR02569 family)